MSDWDTLQYREYLWFEGRKVYDGYEIRREATCDHCHKPIGDESITLLSLRLASLHLVTEMGMGRPLAIHADCIYECIREHVMERVKDKAGRWYVPQEEEEPAKPPVRRARPA